MRFLVLGLMLSASAYAVEPDPAACSGAAEIKAMCLAELGDGSACKSAFDAPLEHYCLAWAEGKGNGDAKCGPLEGDEEKACKAMVDRNLGQCSSVGTGAVKAVCQALGKARVYQGVQVFGADRSKCSYAGRDLKSKCEGMAKGLDLGGKARYTAAVATAAEVRAAEEARAAPTGPLPPLDDARFPAYLFHAAPKDVAPLILRGGLEARSASELGSGSYLAMSAQESGATTLNRASSDIVFRVNTSTLMRDNWRNWGAGQAEWRGISGTGASIVVPGSDLEWRRYGDPSGQFGTDKSLIQE